MRPLLSDGTTGCLFGVFDLFHVAHLDAVLAAARGCDRLVVGVAGDDLVEELCGARPFVPLIERIEIAGALQVVALARPLEDLHDLGAQLAGLGVDRVFLPAELDAVQAAAASTFGPLNATGVEVVRFDAGRRTASSQVRDALARTAVEGVA